MGTTIVVPIYAFVGAKGAWFCRFLAHSSLKLGHLEKSLGVFCSYECPLSTLQISAKSSQGSPINLKSREVFYGHNDSGTHICVCRGQKGRGFCRFLLHSSLKLGHLEKSLR